MRVDSLTLSLLLGASNEADVCCWCDLLPSPLPGRKQAKLIFHMCLQHSVSRQQLSLLFFCSSITWKGLKKKRAQT